MHTYLKAFAVCWAILALVSAFACTTGWLSESRPKRPVIYCTDLFHPHDDPDDHFDVAVLYALDELDVRCIILDQGAKQEHASGSIPVAQMNRHTGKEVPHAAGLAEPLQSPIDQALDQPEAYQHGIRLILDILARCEEPVTLISVGSLRDVAAAFNRQPKLFRERVAGLFIFIGEASASTREWNVGLDPNGFKRIMNSGLPIWWIPCFDGGNFKNKGNASFWKADHADLLGKTSDRVMNFFIYALEKKQLLDPLAYLEGAVDEQARARVLAGKRNLWGSAVFTAAADRKIVERNGEWISLPGDDPEDGAPECRAFRFVPLDLFVDENFRVIYGDSDRAHKVYRFQIVDPDRYPEIMTSVTRHLLGDL